MPTSTPNIHLSIDYDEGKPGTYRAVVVEGPGENEQRFETGDVIADWFWATRYAQEHVKDGLALACLLSSSCDHFVMDDDAYTWDQDSMIKRSEAPHTALEFVQTNKGSERVWKKRTRGILRETYLKEYDVFAQINGERVHIGRVYQDLATFERKTPGKTYVNSRWQSPRWYATAPKEHRRSCEYETRKHASEMLLRGYMDTQVVA